MVSTLLESSSLSFSLFLVPENDRSLACPSVFSTTLCPLFSTLYLDLSSLFFFPPPPHPCSVGSVQLADRHPVPQKEAILVQHGAIVVSNRMDCEVKRSYWFSWLRASNTVNKGGDGGTEGCWHPRKREKQTLCLCNVRPSIYEGETRAVPLSCWVRCGEWTDGKRGRECMNNKRVRVDFLMLPQLIKHLTYWIWQRQEVSGRRMVIKRKKVETGLKISKK